MTVPIEQQRALPEPWQFPSSPPNGHPFPVIHPYQPPVLVCHSQFEPMQMPMHDCPQPFRTMPVEESMVLPYPPPHFSFNGYPSPELGTYIPTQPPEHFVEFAFAFDPYLNNQGRPPYPISLPNAQLPHNFYPHPHPQYSHPQHLIHMPEIRHIPPFEPPPPPMHIFYPSPPQMILTTPHLTVAENGAHLLKPNYRKSPRARVPVLLQVRKPSADTSLQIKNPSCSSVNIKQASSAAVAIPRPMRRNNNIWVVPQRSLLMEDFRNNHHKDWELKSIFSHIVEFSGDQHGSRFIQQQLEEASDEDKRRVFEEIVPHKTDELIRDVFGNYVIQKFFEFGTKTQKDILAKVVEEQVFSLSLHIYGCRVVQKALELISADQQSSMIMCLQSHILTCTKDAHGNHVVQKLIEVVPSQRLTFLPIVCENILELSTHPYGCRVLQRCLEHLPLDAIRPLLDAILRFVIDLVKNQYGNYVIQFIIQFGQDCDKARILSSIQGNLIELSRHKYASNVCEKALTFSDADSRQLLINELMVSRLMNGDSFILTMVHDQYANYVLQRALITSEGQQRDALYDIVKPTLIEIRKSTTTYSRPLVSLERLMDKHFGKHSPPNIQ